jgi:hypothetical protein
MTSGSFSHVVRMLLKGAALGALLSPVLAMIARALFDVVLVTMRDGSMDLLSVIVGLPVFIIDVTIEAAVNGDIAGYILVGLFSGASIALLAVIVPGRIRAAWFAVLCAVLAAVVGLVNIVAPGSVVAPVIDGAQLQWIPVALFMMLAAWIGWRMRRGSVA